MLTSRSGWQIEGDSVYRFGAIRADNVVLDLTRYRFDDRQLVEATHAQRARWEGDAWQLENIATTRIFDNHTESDQTASMGWDTAFTPTQLERLLRDIESQAPSELWAYAQFLEAQGLQNDQALLYFLAEDADAAHHGVVGADCCLLRVWPVAHSCGGHPGVLWRGDRAEFQIRAGFAGACLDHFGFSPSGLFLCRPWRVQG
ncbi:hypothetical protein HSBAA_08130 [Vreelandella sulfidaeris]|uniref:Uncharacterized protein n=1 Tax=Vreelandella sulfidaeris TaxID=115553 RepID=A0A455U1K7_9GAMM|nr:hypothetical protein HSBAA_08130 [Halomonas sulfidaeris]